MHWDSQANICAIASGSQGAARGVVRLSGADSLAIVRRFCRSNFKSDARIELVSDANADLIPNIGRPQSVRGTLQLPLPIGDVPCRLFLWPTSRSYTGQPAAEIHSYGAIP